MNLRWLTLSLVSLGLLALVACGPNPLSFLQPSYKPQDDCGFVQNVYGERISWKGNLPIQLQIHSSFPQQYVGALDAAIKKWEQVAGKPLFRTTNYLEGPILPRQDGVNVIYYMNTWEDNKAGEQARTSVYWVGDTIRETDIRINAKNFTFYWQAPQTSRDVHIESLFIHELGHVLGLKHKDIDNSVMATYLSSQTNRSNISAADSQTLKCEY